MFSVAVATVLFPSLVAARRARRHRRLPRHGLARACARSRSCSFRRASLRPCSPSRSSASSTSAASSAPTRRPSSPARSPPSRSGSTFNGTMLMLNRAFFSLQRPGCRPRSRSATSSLNAALYAALLPRRDLGDPARDLDRQHRGHGRTARPAAAPARPDRVRRDRARARSLDHARLGRARRASPTASGAASTRRSAARSAPSSSRSCARSSPAAARLPRLLAVCWEFASSRRCYRCDAAPAGD